MSAQDEEIVRVVVLADELPANRTVELLERLFERLYPSMREAGREKHPSHYCFSCAYIAAEYLKRNGVKARYRLCSMTLDVEEASKGWIDGLALDATERSRPGSMAGHVIVEIEDETGRYFIDPSAPQYYRDRPGLRHADAILLCDDLYSIWPIADEPYRLHLHYRLEDQTRHTALFRQQLRDNNGYRAELRALTA